MTDEELTAIEARANAATPGPWATHDQGREDYSICRDNGNNTCCPLFERIGPDDDSIDGAFISAARVDVPALVAEVRRLRAELGAAYGHDYAKANPDASTALHDALIVAEGQRDQLRAERDAAVQDATRQLDLRWDANRELVALQREADALRKFVSVSGRWVRKYGTYNAVPTPEALEDFGELMQAYNALEVQP
jgi:hypothetical protein